MLNISPRMSWFSITLSPGDFSTVTATGYRLVKLNPIVRETGVTTYPTKDMVSDSGLDLSKNKLGSAQNSFMERLGTI